MSTCFSSNAMPLVELEINKNKFQAGIDLGSNCELIITDNTFKFENLQYIKSALIVNALGEENAIKVYATPCYKMGGTIANNIKITKASHFGVDLPTIPDIPLKYTLAGRPAAILGSPLMQRSDLFFDWEGPFLWCLQDDEERMHAGIDLKEYVEIPFEVHRGLCTFTIKTVLGELCALLDTGCTRSVIRSRHIEDRFFLIDTLGNRYFNAEDLQIRGINFDPLIFYVVEFMPKEEKFDCILGMDFLLKHNLYIDYTNRKIYLYRK